MTGLAPTSQDESAGGQDEEETALWMAFKTAGSSAARERLFALHEAFARSIARRHHREQSRGDLELAELYQYAYAGLLEALDRFDLGANTPFRPFAAYRISGSILDNIPHISEMREQVSWRRRMRRERLRSLAEDNAGQDTQAPIEKLAELAVGLALGFMLEGTGLFNPRDEEQAASATGESAYDSLAWKETIVHLQSELESLPEREQTILRQHYVNSISFDQLAALLAISKGRVSQLHRAALSLLRKRLREHGHFRMIR
jgi:RNA polymerase sigma factor for flagellar operon FliA